MTTCHLTKDELRRFFEVFDSDGSGGIDPDELCEAFLSLGWADINPTHCDHMIKTQFGPNTSAINFAQFCELVDDVQMPTDSAAECRTAFDYFDKSGIGKICIADLKAAGRAATGAEVPDSLIRQIMDAVDLNKDGYIQFSEFHKAVAKVGIRADEGGDFDDEGEEVAEGSGRRRRAQPTFERESGLGVGFGASHQRADLGTPAEQRRLLHILANGGAAESMAYFGECDYDDPSVAAMLAPDENDENDPNYDPEAGVTLAQTAQSATSASLGGSLRAGAGSRSMVFNGRTVRATNHRSQHWEVKRHITPSQRADIAALEGAEAAQRFTLEGAEERAFSGGADGGILGAFADVLIAEEERVRNAKQLEAQRKAEIAAAKAEEKAAIAAAKAEAAAAARAARNEALEKRRLEREERLNSSRGIGGAGAAFGYGPKPATTKPPTATPRSGGAKAGASVSGTSISTSAMASSAATPTTLGGDGSWGGEGGGGGGASVSSSRNPSASPHANASASSSTTLKTKTAKSASPPRPIGTAKASSSSSSAKGSGAAAVASSSSKSVKFESPMAPEAADDDGADGGAGAGGEKTTLVICKHPATFTNGFISKAEVRRLMVHFFDGDVADDDFDYMFEMGDKDGDGLLSVSDYKNFLELLGYMEI